jgi:hypothetical protein
MLLASGAVLVVARWPRAPAPPVAEATRPSPRVIARNAVRAAPTPRQTLPCFVDGQLVGELTLQDCTSRKGVRSGSVQVIGPNAEASAQAALPATWPPTPPANVEVAQAAPLPPSPAFPSPLPAPARLAVRAPPSGRPPFKARPARATRYAAAERSPAPEAQPRAAATGAVREFYAALGQGDGAKAAAVVAPEARENGPLSAEALTQFYSSLRVPLRVTKIDAIDDETVFVRYQFVTRDDRICLGSATVDTTRRDGGTLISSIRPFDGC